jgi:hypothetical protein
MFRICAPSNSTCLVTLDLLGPPQVSQLATKVVEHDTNLIDLHFCFSKHYQDHERLCHVHEATPLQPDALDQSGHPSSVHALEHGNFPSFAIH